MHGLEGPLTQEWPCSEELKSQHQEREKEEGWHCTGDIALSKGELPKKPEQALNALEEDGWSNICLTPSRGKVLLSDCLLSVFKLHLWTVCDYKE